MRIKCRSRLSHFRCSPDVRFKFHETVVQRHAPAIVVVGFEVRHGADVENFEDVAHIDIDHYASRATDAGIAFDAGGYPLNLKLVRPILCVSMS